MDKCGIYMIHSISHPDRIYIGSAVNIRKRWYVHKGDLKFNKHGSKKLQRHYNKYSINDLEFGIILHGCKKEELIFIEQCFINQYKPYFNSRPTAQNQLGFKFSDESRKKMSKPKSEQHCLNVSIALSGKSKPDGWMIGNKNRLGKKCSEETKAKMRKPKSEEHCLSMSISRKGRKKTEETKKRMSISQKLRYSKLILE